MASSSSYSHSAPASSSSQSSSNWDVFLSFRGEDTRKTFVDHLYKALVDRLINTYKDDEKLPRGDSIGPSLFKAIEGSQIAVIIFSKNYADSSWCLEELAYIMKCKDERGLTVLPVFYDVDPSNVRKQEGDFGRGFAKHEVAEKMSLLSFISLLCGGLFARHEVDENTKKVESWRKALVGAGKIAGWEPKNIANGKIYDMSLERTVRRSGRKSPSKFQNTSEDPILLDSPSTKKKEKAVKETEDPISVQSQSTKKKKRSTQETEDPITVESQSNKKKQKVNKDTEDPIPVDSASVKKNEKENNLHNVSDNAQTKQSTKAMDEKIPIPGKQRVVSFAGSPVREEKSSVKGKQRVVSFAGSPLHLMKSTDPIYTVIGSSSGKGKTQEKLKEGDVKGMSEDDDVNKGVGNSAGDKVKTTKRKKTTNQKTDAGGSNKRNKGVSVSVSRKEKVNKKVGKSVVTKMKSAITQQTGGDIRDVGRSKGNHKGRVPKDGVSINNRCTPHQLCLCIESLTNAQTIGVSEMGFGKILALRTETLPGRLGRYVVDRFSVSDMLMVLDSGQIEITCDSINQLLGLPKEGIDLDLLDRKSEVDPKFKEWKERYGGRRYQISAPELARKIKQSTGENDFLFRVDFLMLFLTTMVECYKNGKCIEGVLRYLSEDVDFKSINWCAYIIKALKRCKKSWNPTAQQSTFTGPLGILMLLYADCVECKAFPVDRSLPAIEFWTTERLGLRERYEIKNGGFGQGKIIGLSLAQCTRSPAILSNQRVSGLSLKKKKDETKGKNIVGGDMTRNLMEHASCSGKSKKDKAIEVGELLVELSKLVQIQEILWENKERFESRFAEIVNQHPNNPQVIVMKREYGDMLDSRPCWLDLPAVEPEEVQKTDSGIVKNLNSYYSDGKTDDEIHSRKKKIEPSVKVKDGVKNVHVGSSVATSKSQGVAVTVEESKSGKDYLEKLAMDSPIKGVVSNDTTKASEVAKENSVKNLKSRKNVTSSCDNVETPGCVEKGVDVDDGYIEDEDEHSSEAEKTETDDDSSDYIGDDFLIDPDLTNDNEAGDAGDIVNAECGLKQANTGEHKEEQGNMSATVTGQTVPGSCTPKTDKIVDTPSFSLGFTQESPSVKKGHETGEQSVNAQPQQSEACYERKYPKRDRILSKFAKSPFMVREVGIENALSKAEEALWSIVFPSNEKGGKRKPRPLSGQGVQIWDWVTVYKNARGMQCDMLQLLTLHKGVRVSNEVIDTWAEVLNHYETYRAPEKSRRLFCSTKLILDWMLTTASEDELTRVTGFTTNMIESLLIPPDQLDLRQYGLVFVPVSEDGRTYLIVFDLKNPEVSVIDSSHSVDAKLKIVWDEDYYECTTPYKVKEMFVKYLEMRNHPKARELRGLSITRVDVEHATKNTLVDNGVYVMRHMEMFMGQEEPFSCGFASNHAKRKVQLNMLRQKYAIKIMLSENNLLREKIIEAVDGAAVEGGSEKDG